MTNTGGTPAGWYHAPGDPEGTHRYWDGAQWLGEPQPVPQQETQAPPTSAPPSDDMTVQYRPPTQESAPPGFDAPNVQQPADGFNPPGVGQTPPDYSAPGTAGGGAPMYAPPGHQGFTPGSSGPGVYAEWGTRAIALLIDWAIGLGIGIVGAAVAAIGFALADVLGVLLAIVAVVAYLAYFIWNFCVRQGNTGQTIGKEKQGIKLVKDDTGQPVGAGMAFVRYLLAGVIGGLCGIYTLLDYLWPLWDVDKKRLTDKMVTMSVITV